MYIIIEQEWEECQTPVNMNNEIYIKAKLKAFKILAFKNEDDDIYFRLDKEKMDDKLFNKLSNYFGKDLYLGIERIDIITKNNDDSIKEISLKIYFIDKESYDININDMKNDKNFIQTILDLMNKFSINRFSMFVGFDRNLYID